jgi:3-hydroxyacyl-CoA dehydrogenase
LEQEIKELKGKVYMDIRTVTVLGANGTMGKNVSGIFASFGNAKVYMVCRSLQDAKNAKIDTTKTVKAEMIQDNLIPKTYADLEYCIKNSDLIFESITERKESKEQIYKQISQYLNVGAIIATGTSGLSINELCASFDDNISSRFLGIHLYNPPYSMTLCEVIPSSHTNKKLLNEIKDYLRDVLYRDVVEVKDKPAFMGNRIGFQFINSSLQFAVKYKDNGGIDYIDAILSGFTGRSMPPLVTSDFVGLDVHKAIVDNVYQNTYGYMHETFILPSFVEALIKQNKLGRKTKSGLYRTILNEEDVKTPQVYDISTEKYRNISKYNFTFAEEIKKFLREGNYTEAFDCMLEDDSEEAKICSEFLIKYVLYSLTISREIGEDIFSADYVMATGFNWIPPLAIIDAFGGCEKFKQIICEKILSSDLATIDIDTLLKDVPHSIYDYRPFFMAF